MKKRLHLKIPASLVKEPIIYKIVSLYNLRPNIVEASLGSASTGEVLLELGGTPEDVDCGIAYLRQLKIHVDEIE